MEGENATTAPEAPYYEPEAVCLADVGPFSPTHIAIKFGPPPTLIVELDAEAPGDSQRLFHSCSTTRWRCTTSRGTWTPKR